MNSFQAGYEDIVRATKCILENSNLELTELTRSECKNYASFATSKERNYKEILSDPILLWGMPDDPKAKPYHYLKFPSTALEIAQSQLRVFMAMQQAYEHLFNVRADKSLFVENVAVPEVVKLPRSEMLLNCQQEVEGKVVNRWILDHAVCFVLLELDANCKNTAKLIKKAKVADITADIDSNKGKRMIVRMPRNSKHSEQITLLLENEEIAHYMKDRIDTYPAKIIQQQTKGILKCLKINCDS
eukprot:TRINITY_DN12985_c0_g1_i12.p1 TRINITY_DN12985_c0_g1~~TRINITY_DN12985_c0_g1_i12.p1  ORF type:complete len:244 (+),score=50.85 TRINITY_DN12985_c0_g1_i12:1992-2723(+)